MHSALRSRQRGMSFISLLLLGFVIVAAFAIGSQSVPIVLEHQSVEKAVNKAASESSNPIEARNAFDRAAQIDDINTITGKDLEVVKSGNGVSIRYEYERDIALFGPVYLVFRFQGQSK